MQGLDFYRFLDYIDRYPAVRTAITRDKYTPAVRQIRSPKATF